MSARTFGLLLLVIGCASTAPRLSRERDPTREDATEAAPLPVSTALDREPAAKPDAPAALELSCPMHPDVVSRTPGQCPRCGMTLQPRKPAP